MIKETYPKSLSINHGKLHAGVTYVSNNVFNLNCYLKIKEILREVHIIFIEYLLL